MSGPTFRQLFRTLTHDCPLQYQKRMHECMAGVRENTECLQVATKAHAGLHLDRGNVQRAF